MDRRKGWAALAVCCVCVVSVGFCTPSGRQAALRAGAPILRGSDSAATRISAAALGPFSSAAGKEPVRASSFWESFFGLSPRPATVDGILESLSGDEVFPELTGEALHPIWATDLHPAGGDGLLEWGGGYIKNRSGLEFDLSELMAGYRPPALSGDEPRVLIYHTHSRETYNDTGEAFADPEVTHGNDPAKSVVAVGEVLKQTLEACGISTLHCTDCFDQSYTGAYYRSDDALAAYLEQYPSLSVLIDLHRDAIYSANGGKYRPVVEKAGLDVAQVMVVCGVGDGEDDNNPHWQENLCFGASLQESLERICPGMTRAMMVYASSYNQYRSPGAILIEVGTTGNTLTEAKRAAFYIALALNGMKGG